MTDLREAVARAIFAGAVGAEHWDSLRHSGERSGCVRAAIAAIRAIEAAGYAVVPREPTKAMIEAISDQAWQSGYCTERPQQNYSGGSALFTEAEAAPMVRAMLAAGDLLGGRGS